MGTRADFYLRNADSWEWLGSTGHDGYEIEDDTGHPVRDATNEASFRAAIAAHLEACGSGAVLPEEGWPWPWTDSRTTDYAYVFDVPSGRLQRSRGGRALVDIDQEIGAAYYDGPKLAIWPTMERGMNMRVGPIILAVPGD